MYFFLLLLLINFIWKGTMQSININIAIKCFVAELA